MYVLRRIRMYVVMASIWSSFLLTLVTYTNPYNYLPKLIIIRLYSVGLDWEKLVKVCLCVFGTLLVMITYISVHTHLYNPPSSYNQKSLWFSLQSVYISFSILSLVLSSLIQTHKNGLLLLVSITFNIIALHRIAD